jgi:hypothetical protein
MTRFFRVAATSFLLVLGGSAGMATGQTIGSIAAWGWDYLDQCDVPAPNSDFVAVAAGYYHSLGLKADGSIVAWGRNDYSQLNVPAPNSGFVAVAAGGHHNLAIRGDGDGDGDGVPDSLDLCLNTIPGSPVDADGCPPMIPFDFLRDGDVDARDLMVFDFCSTGPTIVGPPAGCAQATFDMLDRDQDGDVDQNDFGVFQRCYSGENHPADPACAE